MSLFLGVPAGAHLKPSLNVNGIMGLPKMWGAAYAWEDKNETSHFCRNGMIVCKTRSDYEIGR